MSRRAPEPRRWIAWWTDYWFAPATAVRLAVLRIILVAVHLLLFQRGLADQLLLAESNASFHRPQVLIASLAALVGESFLRSPELLTGIWWATTVAGGLTLAGCWTRPAALVFALGNWLLVAHDYSYGEKHHPEAIFCIFLMLLALSPCHRCLSVDSWRHRRAGDGSWGISRRLTTAVWAIKTTQWLVAMAYFGAGSAKILYPAVKQGLPLGQSVEAWLSGRTLQLYVLEDALRHEVWLGQWLARHPLLCMLGAWAALMVELGFWLVLLFPRWAPLFLIAGLALHWGIGLTMGFWFTNFWVLYLLWVPFEKLPWFRRSGGLTP